MSKIRILLIDDDVEVLRVLQLGLEYSGFETLIASGPAEAQKILREDDFDLVVCDLNMPGENGMEFRERMALTHRNLPGFLFCSGLPLCPVEPPYPEGIVGFLMKPFSVKEFIETVRSHSMAIPRGENSDSSLNALYL